MGGQRRQETGGTWWPRSLSTSLVSFMFSRVSARDFLASRGSWCSVTWARVPGVQGVQGMQEVQGVQGVQGGAGRCREMQGVQDGAG